MEDLSIEELRERTTRWTAQITPFLDSSSCAAEAEPDPLAWLALVEAGVALRRQWDRLDCAAPERRQLLQQLATAQNLAQQQVAAALARPSFPAAEIAAELRRELDADGRYLADLLNEHAAAAEIVAFGLECLRDDLHWRGALAAVLEGSEDADFLGRILLEQEALQRVTDAWEAEAENESAEEVDQRAQLHRAAHRLRMATLARRVEDLTSRPEPGDAQGWFATWQAASRLAMRLGGEKRARCGPAVATPASGEGECLAKRDKFWLMQAHEATQHYLRLCQHRAQAVRRWRQALEELPPAARGPVLERQIRDLADSTADVATFLEDLPLPDAVRNLEILADDLRLCLQAVAAVPPGDAAALRRALRRPRRVVAAELQERQLALRMERLLGHGFVVALERTLLALLVAFVVLLAIEEPLLRQEARRNRLRRAGAAESHAVEATLAWVDLGLCLVLLGDFALRFSLAQRKGLYLRRNWLTGLVPAIPVGFLLFALHRLRAAELGELFVLLRFLRYLRLPQMVRWLRIARPALRIARLVAFSFRASDRLARQLSPLLNRNLVLFEQATLDAPPPAHRLALLTLRNQFSDRGQEIIEGLPRASRRWLARVRMEDLTTVLAAPSLGVLHPNGDRPSSTGRDFPLEQVISQLLTATPTAVAEQLGRGVTRSIARWCSAFDVWGLRRLPLARDLAEAGRLGNPQETTARVANRLGLWLQRLLEYVYWLADLHGTVTAPQLVDSLGEWMIRGTAKPARRLLLFGGGFVIVSYLASLLPFETLNFLTGKLRQFIGTPLVVLGGLCLVFLFLGMWFRQIAGAATGFFNQVAEAQFITVTKRLKQRLARRHHALLRQRVVEPEGQLATGAAHDLPHERIAAAERTVEELWNDYLDSAPFHRSDTKTTTQLLGNVLLVSLRETRLPMGRKRRKRLRQLDLEATRGSIRGPYLWFHFVARSLAHQTARLIVDYDAHALPLARGATASDEEVRAHILWLARRRGCLPAELDLPEVFRRRMRPEWSRTEATAAPPAGYRRRGVQSGDFTAIHFLTADAEVETDIRRRYGDLVADLMRRDRRDNVRRVFRTYPLHHWPREQRTFNPLRLYERHLAGGLVLLLPLKLLWWTVKLLARAVRLLGRFIREVLHPVVGEIVETGQIDPQGVAVRKIHRMRKPVFLECLRMRAEFDPEYLGIGLPGSAWLLRGAAGAPVDEDLRHIDADPLVTREMRELGSRRRRQVLDFRRWLARLDPGRQSAESLRAMTIAYVINFRRLRARLESVAGLEQALAKAASTDGAPSVRHALRRLWRMLWGRGRWERLVRQPTFARWAAERRRCRAAIFSSNRAVWRAFCELTRPDGPDDPVGEARRQLLDIAADPDTWTSQLVVLRAVQTLTVLDLQIYRDLVAELGEYGRDTPHFEETIATWP